MIVETGIGVLNANCYATVDEADAYADAVFDDDWLNLDDDEKERRLIISSRFLDRRYQKEWVGTRKSSTQGMAWPRVGNRNALTLLEQQLSSDIGLIDSDGFSLEDIVPQNLKRAVYELSKSFSTGQKTLYPVSPTQSNLKSESVTVGVISISQSFTDAAMADDSRTVPSEVEDLLADLVVSQGAHMARVLRF